MGFYLGGNLIDVLDIQFVFPGKPEQTEITSIKIEIGENFCDDREPSISFNEIKQVATQGKKYEVKYSFSGENSRAVKMIDQNVVLALRVVARTFFDAEEAKSVSILSSVFRYLRLT